MKNYNLYMTIQTPNLPDPEPEESPTYEEVHNDGNSGYGNSED